MARHWESHPRKHAGSTLVPPLTALLMWMNTYAFYFFLRLATRSCSFSGRTSAVYGVSASLWWVFGFTLPRQSVGCSFFTERCSRFVLPVVAAATGFSYCQGDRWSELRTFRFPVRTSVGRRRPIDNRSFSARFSSRVPRVYSASSLQTSGRILFCSLVVFLQQGAVLMPPLASLTAPPLLGCGLFPAASSTRTRQCSVGTESGLLFL